MSWTRFVFALTTLTALLVPTPFNTPLLAAQRNPPAWSPQTLPLKFSAVKDYSTGTFANGFVTVGDLRGNGYADLVIASCTSTPEIEVLLGNGNGTFNAPTSYASGGSCPTSIAIGDVNGDGHTDLVVANLYKGAFSLEGEVSVFVGNDTGTFGPPVNYDSGGSGAQSVAIADVNGDGYPDLIIANQYGSSGSGNGVVAVLLSDGHGSFQTPVSYSAGGFLTDSAAVGDFNGDGHPDIVVASKCHIDENCNTTTGVLGVLLNKGDGTFAAPVIYGAGGFMYALSVVTGDLNGDGHLDLVVGNWCQNIDCAGGVVGGVSVLLGKGNGGFQPAVTYSSGSVPAGSVALGDLNGDGHPDVLVNGGASVGGGYVINALLGNGDGTLRAPVSYNTGGSEPESVAITDVNGDGRPDLVAGFNGAVGVFLNELREPSTIAVNSSNNPSIINQPVTFSATVTSASPVPNGSPVTFYANSSEIGTGSTKNGVAKVTKVFTLARTCTIKASYAGDPFHSESLGYLAAQKVTLYPSTTTLTSSPNPSTSGQAVTLTATVRSSATGGPTGWVTFLNGTTSLGAVKLSSGTATLITTKLPVGTLTLSANYEGDTQSAKSSKTTSQTVN